MTTTTDHNLEELAARLGATIITHDGGEKGRYYGRGIISLRRNLGPKNYRCTLAHELAHHILKHDPNATGWLHERQEKQADEYAAAKLLIDAIEWETAERCYGPHLGAIASEVGVTRRVAQIWRSITQQQLNV